MGGGDDKQQSHSFFNHMSEIAAQKKPKTGEKSGYLLLKYTI